MNAHQQASNLEIVLAAIEHIENNLEEDINVDSVCSLSSKSKWQTQRVFRAISGDSVSGYIRGRKLSAAFHLLKDTLTPISELALRFGFGSQEAFARAFKERFGVSPRSIRNSKYSYSQFLKPKLTKEKLQFIAKSISQQPDFQLLPSKEFVGLSTEINAPFAEVSIFNESLLDHWRKFRQLCKTERLYYGLTKGVANDGAPPTLVYTSAIESTGGEVLPSLQLQKFEVTSQYYAVFEIRGPINLCHAITDYIYGIWLPQSGHQRANGFEIDLYDTRVFKLNSTNSTSYRYVPILQG